jgi:hypothetical protein
MRRFLNAKIIDPAGANNATGTATVVSSAIETFPYDNSVSFEVQTTGTPSGTITMEGSDQYDPTNNPNATFIPINTVFNGVVIPTIAGAPVSAYFTHTRPVMSKWMRIRYVNSAGSGTISIWAFGKGRN